MFNFPTDLKTDERGLANDIEQLREMVHTLSNIAYNLAENEAIMVLALTVGVPNDITGYIRKAHVCVCTCDKPSEGMGVDEAWSLPIPTQALN
jgi:hypothetical protein